MPQLTKINNDRVYTRPIQIMRATRSVHFFFQAMVHFNQQLAINRDLRDEIDHLRRERAVFENLYKKLAKELENCKKDMSEVIETSTQAFEQR